MGACFLSIDQLCSETCHRPASCGLFRPISPGKFGHEPFRHVLVFEAIVGTWNCKNTLCSIEGHLQGRGSRRSLTLLSPRNTGLVLRTEAHHDPSVPGQRGAVPGLRVQQEVDDEPVRSRLKRPGGSRPKAGCSRTAVDLRAAWSTRPMCNCFDFRAFCCCLPFLYPKC